MAYLRRLHFLLILEKSLTFLSDELDVFKMVSRYDNRRACIAPYNSKMASQPQAVPFTTQTRLTFDVVLPLWGPRGPRPTPPSARVQRSPLC